MDGHYAEFDPRVLDETTVSLAAAGHRPEYDDAPELPFGPPPPPPPPTWAGIPAVSWTWHGKRVLAQGVYSYRP